MTEIKNLLFQPLTFHLVGGKGIHLGPRERREVPESDISPEIALAARRGLVLLLPLPEPATHARIAPPPESSSEPRASAEAASAIEGSSTSAPDDEAVTSGRRKKR